MRPSFEVQNAPSQQASPSSGERGIRGVAVLVLFLAFSVAAFGLELEGTEAVRTPEDLRPKAVTDLEGIWKLCYEPGLPGVDEIDTGYLVLMPGGMYFEIRETCCYDGTGPEPPHWDLKSYRIDGAGDLLLEAVTFAGESYERVLHRGGLRSAVFFDEIEGPVRRVETLLRGKSLNYGYCRAYPVK